MTRVVIPGSFDPVTVGHLDIVARARSLFDEVIVTVVHNPAKSTLFSIDERVDFLRDALAVSGDRAPGLGSVSVDVLAGGLLVDYCHRLAAQAVIKGVRSATDVDYESPMARMNRHLSGLETVLLLSAPELAHISSSLVKEVSAHEGDVEGLVPAAVLAALDARSRGADA